MGRPGHHDQRAVRPANPAGTHGEADTRSLGEFFEPLTQPPAVVEGGGRQALEGARGAWEQVDRHRRREVPHDEKRESGQEQVAQRRFQKVCNGGVREGRARRGHPHAYDDSWWSERSSK